MSSYKSELISIINNSENPIEAIKIALEITTSFSLQHVSSQQPLAEIQREFGQMPQAVP